MEFNEFTLKPLRMKLCEMFPELVGINIIKPYQGGSISYSTHFMIYKFNFNGIIIYYEDDIFNNKDVFEQCSIFIKDKIETYYLYIDKDRIYHQFAERQIISALIYRIGKTVEKYNSELFYQLAIDCVSKNSNLFQLQKYIEDSFDIGGHWEKMLDGPEGLDIITAPRN